VPIQRRNGFVNTSTLWRWVRIEGALNLAYINSSAATCTCPNQLRKFLLNPYSHLSMGEHRFYHTAAITTASISKAWKNYWGPGPAWHQAVSRRWASSSSDWSWLCDQEGSQCASWGKKGRLGFHLRPSQRLTGNHNQLFIKILCTVTKLAPGLISSLGILLPHKHYTCEGPGCLLFS
jgi:hypothetical protein